MTASSLSLTARSRPAWGRLARAGRQIGAASGPVNTGSRHVTRALGMIAALQLMHLVGAAAVWWAVPRAAERAA